MNISFQANLTQIFLRRRTELIALLSAFTVTALTGIILSSVLVLSILTRPRLRTGSGILVVNQQILHVLQTGFSNPFYIVTGWAVRLGGFSITIDCTTMDFFSQVFLCAETWSSFFVGVNRFVALIYPHQYGRISSKAVVAGFIIAAWCISAVVEIPAIMGIWIVFGLRVQEGDCGYVRITDQRILLLRGAFGYYVPLVAQALLYAFILVNYYRRDKENRTAAVQKKRFDLFRLVFASYVWYVVCYMPYLVSIYVFPVWFFADKIRIGWLIFLQEIGYAGSPVFLLLLNKDIVASAKQGVRSIKQICCKSDSVMPVAKNPTSAFDPTRTL